jgi:hypothetical protein
MKRNKNGKDGQANLLSEAIRLFQQGKATPESLFVIMSGVHETIRAMVDSGEVSPLSETLKTFLDVEIQQIAKTRTAIVNKRISNV